MSENITIKELLDLTESIFAKMSDITLEATIKDVKQAYERKVKSGEREGQVFYSQKLTIDDGTGSIVVDFIAGTAEDTIPKSALGRRVRVEDAKTDVYKGERRLAKGKLTPLDNGNPPQDGSGVPDAKKEERDYWDSKQKRQGREITRIALAKSLIEAGRKWGSPTKKEADGWFDWVMDGKEPKDAPEKKETTEEKETSARVALRKTWQGLNKKLADKEYWTVCYGSKTEDEGYRLWLDDEFQVASSGFLTDEQMKDGIEKMAKWLSNLVKKGNGDAD